MKAPRPPQDANRVLADARRALFVMAGVMAVIWLLQLVNWLDGYWLSRHYGIVAHDSSRLPDILAAPFLHWSFAHIEANSAPLFFLGFLAAYRGIRRFIAVSLVIIVASGLGSWFFDSAHTVGTGASGVVFGYFSYVVLRGVVERHLVDVIVGVVVAVSYWSILQGVVPADPHISWQAHLFGLLGGIGPRWCSGNGWPRPAHYSLSRRAAGPSCLRASGKRPHLRTARTHVPRSTKSSTTSASTKRATISVCVDRKTSIPTLRSAPPR
jgi:membrane associated rhomboid family serine protease